MKNSLSADCGEIEEMEAVRASTGQLPVPQTHVSALVHESIIKDCDFRKSLALGSLNKEEAPLTFARSLIQCGNLSDAKEALDVLERDSAVDRQAMALIHFEQTRIAALESDWPKTIQRAAEAFHFHPKPVTQLALFQIRANTFFEMGLLPEARRDVEQVEALGVLFPHALSLLYARTLMIRIVARELGPDSALRMLEQLFEKNVKLNPCNFELVLSYLRLKIDIQRVRGLPALSESAACYLLASAMGDKVYAGLAAADIYCEFGRDVPDFLISHLSGVVREFKRVGNAMDEMHSESPRTATGRTMAEHRKISFINSSHPLLRNDLLARILGETPLDQIIIVLSDKNMTLHLSPPRIMTSARENQFILTLKQLSQGKISKEALFLAIWGTQRYTPHLHDTLISTLLHRLKKSYGIVVKCQKNLVFCEKEILVL